MENIIQLTAYQIDMITRIVNLQEDYWIKMNQIADLQLKEAQKT